MAKKVVKKAKKKAQKKVEPSYKKGFILIGHRIIEASLSTKRKSAYIKVVIPDELAEKIIASTMISGTEDFPVRALGLGWYELEAK